MENTSLPVNDEVDVEAFAIRGEPLPAAKRYIIRVDKQRVVVETPTIAGGEILVKVGLSPQTHKLYQHQRGHQPKLIDPNDVVDLRAPGVERFTTMPKDTTEGGGALDVRRAFRLPQVDEHYLGGLQLEWETVIDDRTQWLVIHGWQVPTGYNRARVSLALLIPPNYADTQIDMVYFRSALARVDGKPIAALSDQVICGETWQRWSRHRTDRNPWRRDVDDVASHLTLVDEWLRRELERT